MTARRRWDGTRPGRSGGLLAVLVLVAGAASAQPPEAGDGGLAIREVTVFKDGHAFVLAEGERSVSEDGTVVLDHVPAPVLGTLWPFVEAPGTRLQGVVAGRRQRVVERTALNLRQLLEANLGAEVFIQEKDAKYFGTLLRVPTRDEAELRRTQPPGAEPDAEERGNVILIGTAEGTRVVPFDAIQQVTFRKEPAAVLRAPEKRNLLTFDLSWTGERPARAKVGMVYLQKGLRWIPSYRIHIDGGGNARLELAGTLVNDLADLDHVTAHFVIGVPSFAMKDVLDPMSLLQTAAQVGRELQQQRSQTGNFLSNAITTQVWAADPGARSTEGEGGPEVLGSGATEDLFIFSVKDVTLRRGERLVVPLGELALPYRDVYVLEHDVRPPVEVSENLNITQREELARAVAGTKVEHRLRLTNRADQPLTTAPALILREGRILGQGLMTYTPVGASVDVTVTTAVNVRSRLRDRETRRVPDALRWNNEVFGRVEFEGSITLTNHGQQAVEVEVTRRVLGNAESADREGEIVKLDWQTDPEILARRGHPWWWNWFPWPRWWHQLNGLSEISWKVKVAPGESLDLTYRWHYFWK